MRQDIKYSLSLSLSLSISIDRVCESLDCLGDFYCIVVGFVPGSPLCSKITPCMDNLPLSQPSGLFLVACDAVQALIYLNEGRRGRDRMAIELTTVYAISAYRH